MDMRKWFFLSVIFLALVVGGCGGNGNGGGMAGGGTPDPEPEPMECPAGQTGTYPNCMTPPPPAPAGGHNAVIDGIVNPMKAGDPSTARPTGHLSRPGNAQDGNEVELEAFSVTAGALGMEPTTTIGMTGGVNAAAAAGLQRDQLDEDDMTTDATPKSFEGQFMNQDMDSMLGQFAGSVHEKMTGEGDKRTVDTINVFTNIDAAKPATFASYYGTVRASDGITGYDTTERELALATGDDTGKLSLFSGSKIPTGANQNFPIPADDSETTGVMENEFTGMFNGVAGTYACTGACSAETDDKSKLTLNGTWTFTPTEEDHTKIMLPGVQYDHDYLSFGYWVRTTGEGDDTKYGVGTFFDGSQPFTAALTSIVGTATYSGKAAGMYGRKTLDQYGQVVSGSETSGHFTADANLTARFGTDNNVGLVKQNQIEGTVSNFMDGSKEISPNWEVTLNPIDFGETDNVDTNSFLNGTTAGGGNAGNWQGAFFGNPGVSNDVGTPVAENAPTGVAGEFTGHFTNGHVIGAFGATKDK